MRIGIYTEKVLSTKGNSNEKHGGFMREKTIEAKLVKAVKAKGGLALKFICPGLNGVPDRLVLLPKGKIAFIELKAPGETMRPLQVKRKRQLELLGFLVYCIDSAEKIGVIINEIQTT